MGSFCGIFSSTPKEKDDMLAVFWSSVLLRRDPVSNLVIQFKTLRLDSPNATLKKEDWEKNIVHRFLVSDKYEAESLRLWSYVYDKYYNSWQYLLLSLFFICQKDNEVEKEFKNLLLSFNIVEKDVNLVIERAKLFEIVKIYVHIISSLSLDFLKNIIGEEEYVKSKSEAFASQIQDEFINNLLNEVGSTDKIDITMFYVKHYDLLVNDAKIRGHLYGLWKSKNNKEY